MSALVMCLHALVWCDSDAKLWRAESLQPIGCTGSARHPGPSPLTHSWRAWRQNKKKERRAFLSLSKIKKETVIKKEGLLSYSGGGLSQNTPPGEGCSQEDFLYKFSRNLLG